MPDNDVPEYQNWPTSHEDREELARDVFGRYLTLTHDAALDNASRMLFEEYRYKSATVWQEQVFAWISSLSEEERRNALAFVQEIVAGTIFSLLNKVDGTGGILVEGSDTSREGVYGDYSDRLHIRLDIYRDTYKDGQEKDLVESLPINQQGESQRQDLHDLWFGWLEKHSRWK